MPVLYRPGFIHARCACRRGSDPGRSGSRGRHRTGVCSLGYRCSAQRGQIWTDESRRRRRTRGTGSKLTYLTPDSGLAYTYPRFTE